MTHVLSHLRPFRFGAAMALLALVLPSTARAGDPRTGEQVYRDACLRCHGPHGEGVKDEYERPLAGDKTLPSLQKLIIETMPEDKPGSLSADDANTVSEYVFERFYSEAARAKELPATKAFSRLTVPQYRMSVADLVASFGEPSGRAQPGGLKAEYFASKDTRDDKRVIERVDPVVEFSFGSGSPDAEKITGDEFAIRWRGSVIVEETGEYEFVVRSENGVRLWLNGGERATGGGGRRGGGDRDRRKPLIDEWVSSGAEPREHKRSLFLIGGRAYPLRLETFRFKDKTASIALRWKPPHGVTQTIPARHLSAANVAETLVVATPFPPDDGSAGYPRGTSVSKAWEQAVIAAAVEVANKVVDRIDDLSKSKPDAGDRGQKLKDFAATFAQRAFRRPLTDAETSLFRDKAFEGAKDGETAVKRAVLLALMSPKFLYPELDGDDGNPGANADGYAVASRLALGLWDSLPDRDLLEAAKSGQLDSPDKVARRAKKMLEDPRAHAKVRDFLHQWLSTEEAHDVRKDPAAYPDFNEEVLADLRTSLDLFLDEVVWGNGGSDYRQLLLSNDIYLNERLAKFLGAKAPEGEEIKKLGGFGKVGFDTAQRSGVLTHPYLLAALAYNKQSSPIHRGVFLTRNIVGRSLRPPPDAIAFDDASFNPDLTMREKVTELTRSANCMGCHAVINPLGFSLEHYDAVGRFRETDNNKPVDATSDYPAPDGSTIKLDGARAVAEHAANSPDAHRAFIRQMFNHVAKQPAEAYGPDVMESLRKSFAESNFNVRSLVVEIAKVSSLHGVKPAVATAKE